MSNITPIKQKEAKERDKSNKKDKNNPQNTNNPEPDQNNSPKPLTKSHPNFNIKEDVDFSLLSPDILKRYKKTFKLKTKTTPKGDLVNAVSNHFNNDINIDENATVY